MTSDITNRKNLSLSIVLENISILLNVVSKYMTSNIMNNTMKGMHYANDWSCMVLNVKQIQFPV